MEETERKQEWHEDLEVVSETAEVVVEVAVGLAVNVLVAADGRHPKDR